VKYRKEIATVILSYTIGWFIWWNPATEIYELKNIPQLNLIIYRILFDLLTQLVTSVTSFIIFLAVSPSAAVLIATHSVPDILYCLQIVSCSRWKGGNSGACCNCDIGKHEDTWTIFTVFIGAGFVSSLCLQSHSNPKTPPLSLLKHNDLRAHNFSQSPDLEHQPIPAKVPCPWSWIYAELYLWYTTLIIKFEL
jgi:hypothetical protein